MNTHLCVASNKKWLKLATPNFPDYKQNNRTSGEKSQFFPTSEHKTDPNQSLMGLSQSGRTKLALAG